MNAVATAPGSVKVVYAVRELEPETRYLKPDTRHLLLVHVIYNPGVVIGKKKRIVT